LANTLSLYNTEFITSVKSFIVVKIVKFMKGIFILV